MTKADMALVENVRKTQSVWDELREKSFHNLVFDGIDALEGHLEYALREMELINCPKIGVHYKQAIHQHSKANKKALTRRAFLFARSLTMTYFHMRTHTIIGAKSFHCPVRDGKEWGQLAMVVRHNWRLSGPPEPGGPIGHQLEEASGFDCLSLRNDSLVLNVIGSSLTGN